MKENQNKVGSIYEGKYRIKLFRRVNLMTQDNPSITVVLCFGKSYIS